MIDLLKRFEDGSLNDDPFTNPESSDDEGVGGDGDDEGVGGDGDDRDDLERRLAGIDLGEFCCSPHGWHGHRTIHIAGSASEDKIWAVLTPEERARFTQAVQDPGSELAKTLLTSPDLAEDIDAPWWVTLPNTPQANAPVSRPARPPDVMAIPEALLTDSASPSHDPPAFPLVYNLVAILWVTTNAPRKLPTYPFTREVLHMHLLRDIFPLTRSLPPLKRNPSFLVSCPFSSHETTRHASLASSLRARTYIHVLARYARRPKS